jgi:hypothetical protein
MALGRIARGDLVAQIEDAAADEELLSHPTMRGGVELAGFRTVLAVALRKDGGNSRATSRDRCSAAAAAVEKTSRRAMLT